MDKINENLELDLEVSWNEINQNECDDASFNNMGCWKEFD